MLWLMSRQQGADQVRLFFELLEVELVGAAENLPVEVPQVVAGCVLAVLGELDGEAVVGTAVYAGDVPFHDQPGTQLKPFQLSERLRI